MLTIKDFRWTFMADLPVAACVKIVNTTPRASIATSANRNSIGHTESIGTKRMCADVRWSLYAKFWKKKWFNFNCRIISACSCDNFFSTGNCEEESGRCECRPEFQAPDCQDCSYGHFGYPNCRPCECNLLGSTGDQCQATNGVCSCKPNFAGDFCNRCADGYFGPDCLPCNCDLTGSLNDVCDAISGQCPCSSQFDGKQCERCKDGYFGFPSCPCK